MAFYEGRQDEFVWLDLVRQFRNPEKQQIIPINLTKEIIDETSILYKEAPIYKVVDSKTGKALPKDEKLWEKIQEKAKYLTIMDRLDRWCRLLGTVLVKVSFVDESTGQLVGEDNGGTVQLDLMHSGVYDLKHGASPYYITELLVGFGSSFGGMSGSSKMGGPRQGVAKTIASPGKLEKVDIELNKGKIVGNSSQLGKINEIYWSPNAHKQIDEGGNELHVENPYGVIPAVPFFNSDPAHYYFLPINEPLIYANHATNMRLTDLNHIAKYQSFGVPVLSGVERPTGTRQGRPVDDFNQLRGGLAQARFGGLVGGAAGAGGSFRNHDAGFGMFRDGNADANALGFSIGPDTAIAVGEKGDFRFEHPKADIVGLLKTIESTTDMIRVNHGLRPKYREKTSASGFALWLEKSGVIDENRRRGQLFKEREQQLFQVIKKLWNTHYSKSGEQRFSDNAKLEITYVEPRFPVDPKTQMETIIIEQKIRQTGDKQAYKQLYPWMTDADITKAIKDTRADHAEQKLSEAETELEIAELYDSKDKEYAGVPSKQDIAVSGSKIDNKAKHSSDSSKQPGKQGPAGKRGAPVGNKNRLGKTNDSVDI